MLTKHLFVQQPVPVGLHDGVRDYRVRAGSAQALDHQREEKEDGQKEGQVADLWEARGIRAHSKPRLRTLPSHLTPRKSARKTQNQTMPRPAISIHCSWPVSAMVADLPRIVSLKGREPRFTMHRLEPQQRLACEKS